MKAKTPIRWGKSNKNPKKILLRTTCHGKRVEGEGGDIPRSSIIRKKKAERDRGTASGKGCSIHDRIR